MDFNYIQINIIHKYWKTLIRKNISNMQQNKFIKKPYLENYIIKLSSILDEKILNNKITEMFECNEITNEELYLYLNSNIELSIEDKKNIEKFLFKKDINNSVFLDISYKIIDYQIKYFKFYNTITELLFDNKMEDNELYNFILIYIQNKKNDIKNYSKKNIKFNIFYYYVNDLYLSFEYILKLLIEYNLVSNIDHKEILNLFIKNLFTNWYHIYKKDILENKVNDKIKNYTVSKNILSRILCLPNYV
jgi:hypothetical protein